MSCRRRRGEHKAPKLRSKQFWDICFLWGDETTRGPKRTKERGLEKLLAARPSPCRRAAWSMAGARTRRALERERESVAIMEGDYACGQCYSHLAANSHW